MALHLGIGRSIVRIVEGARPRAIPVAVAVAAPSIIARRGPGAASIGGNRWAA